MNTSSSNPNPSDNSSRELTTCVLLAETLSSDFHSDAKLVDFNSASVLDFNLNWLADNKFKECFVLYSTSKQHIEPYLQEIQHRVGTMRLHPVLVSSTECKTFGDFMREVNFRQIVSKDFLLVHGDLITNVNLRPAIEQHQQRRQQSKISVLTILLGKGSHRECYLLDRNTKEILQIHDFGRPFGLNDERVSLKKHCDSLVLRNDLTPASIYICSTEVLKSFKETYEFNSMNDFVTGMLTSEIYEEKIHSYELKNNDVAIRVNYAAGLYEAYSSLMSRYLYPYIIQITAAAGPVKAAKAGKNSPEQFVKYLDYNKYIKSKCPLQTVKLSHGTYLGEGSMLGGGSSLLKSIICRNADVGANSSLKYCIVLENVVVPENSHYEYCLLEMNEGKLCATNFRKEVCRQPSPLDDCELFPKTPEPEENFEEELKILISEKPCEETYEELAALRKTFNREPLEFTTDALVLLHPATAKDIEKVVKEWGSLLKRTCLNESSTLINASMQCCRRSPPIRPAFHVFIQYMYKFGLLNEHDIIGWHSINKSVPNNEYFAGLCNKFVNDMVEYLKQEQEQQQQEDQEEGDLNQ